MELGPHDGAVTVRTGVAGSASRMGHRLVLEVQDWGAQVDFADDAPVSVRFTAALDSLRVVSGAGGVTPLTVVDKQVIRRNAIKVLQTDEHPDAVFDAKIERSGDGYLVSGDLLIHGVSQPMTAQLSVQDGHVTASVPVVQTEFGLRPYSAMLGQLKVLDEVSVDLDIRVPA